MMLFIFCFYSYSLYPGTFIEASNNVPHVKIVVSQKRLLHQGARILSSGNTDILSIGHHGLSGERHVAESDEFRLKTVRFVSIIKKTIDAPQVSAQSDRLYNIFYI